MSLYQSMARELASYNRWQNETLYGLCRDLGDTRCHEDLELFFGSIHATLNHILYVDRVLLDYATLGRPPGDFAPATILHQDFDQLERARVDQDRTIEDTVDRVEPEWFEGEVRFVSSRLERERCFPRALLITQMFNHQTHHRSQITGALHRLGVDYGITDLPMNPLSAY